MTQEINNTLSTLDITETYDNVVSRYNRLDELAKPIYFDISYARPMGFCGVDTQLYFGKTIWQILADSAKTYLIH